MKEPDPLGDFKKLLLRKKLEEIVAMPATLYSQQESLLN
jgi:hypothetical protein